MTRFAAFLIAAFAPAIAIAQPATDAPADPAAVLAPAPPAPAPAPTQENDAERPANEPPPPPPAPVYQPPVIEPAPADPVARCKVERANSMRIAQSTADVHVRTRLLTTLPDCAGLEARLHDGGGDDESGEKQRTGATGEISGGLGVITAGNDSLKGPVLNWGVGGFLSKNLALTLRMAGVAIIEGGLGYAGFIGPSAQAWLADQFWLGGGIGVGFVGGCGGGGCGAYKGAGFDMRMGFAFDKTGHGGNASVEITKISEFPFTTVALTLGYQGF